MHIQGQNANLIKIRIGEGGSIIRTIRENKMKTGSIIRARVRNATGEIKKVAFYDMPRVCRITIGVRSYSLAVSGISFCVEHIFGLTDRNPPGLVGLQDRLQGDRPTLSLLLLRRPPLWEPSEPKREEMS